MLRRLLVPVIVVAVVIALSADVRGPKTGWSQEQSDEAFSWWHAPTGAQWQPAGPVFVVAEHVERFDLTTGRAASRVMGWISQRGDFCMATVHAFGFSGAQCATYVSVASHPIGWLAAVSGLTPCTVMFGGWVAGPAAAVRLTLGHHAIVAPIVEIIADDSQPVHAWAAYVRLPKAGTYAINTAALDSSGSVTVVMEWTTDRCA